MFLQFPEGINLGVTASKGEDRIRIQIHLGKCQNDLRRQMKLSREKQNKGIHGDKNNQLLKIQMGNNWISNPGAIAQGTDKTLKTSALFH